MKNKIIILLFILLYKSGVAENPVFEYKGRSTPSVKKEKLNEIKFVNDITPELWHRLILPQKERIKLDSMRKMEYSLGCYLYPLGGYEILIDYASVEISASFNGKIFSSKSTDDKLTEEQKNILNTADLGTDINIKILFRYKKSASIDNKIIEGILAVTVVPTEAEYPGGFKELTEYVTKNIFNKINEKSTLEKLRNAIVKFTVDEQGKVMDVKIFRTSGDLRIDQLIIDNFNKMPKWKPAEVSKGIKTKQEFTIPFGNDGC